MAVVVAYGVVSILATIFQCQPLHKAYEAKVQGHCIDLVASWYATAAFTMITDFLILIMPMPLIRSLKLPRAQRIGLMVVFALGGLYVLCQTTPNISWQVKLILRRLVFALLP